MTLDRSRGIDLVLEVVEEVAVPLEDDVTAVPSTSLYVVVDGAGGWFEGSVGRGGGLSDCENPLPSVSQSEDIAQAVFAQVSWASHQLHLHLGPFHQLQEGGVRCGGRTEILRIQSHSFTVLGSLGRALNDLLRVFGGVHSEEELLCKEDLSQRGN